MHQQIAMTPCKSSSLSAHGYHHETQTLAVQFKEDGPVYLFTKVPAELHQEMQKAESFGRFFQTRIKGKFGDAVKVDPKTWKPL